jgi:hypothetical protein
MIGTNTGPTGESYLDHGTLDWQDHLIKRCLTAHEISSKRSRASEAASLRLEDHLDSPFECAITTSVAICFRKHRNANVRRHSLPVKRLVGTGEIELGRHSERPTIWQFPSPDIREHSLGVFPNECHSRGSSHKRHRERFATADGLRPRLATQGSRGTLAAPTRQPKLTVAL